MTKKERICIKYGLLRPKIAESDAVSLIHGLCGSGGSHPFQIRTQAKTHSMLALTMIDPATGWFEIVKATNKSATSIQDLIHNTWLARYSRIAYEYKVGNQVLLETPGILWKLSTPHTGPYPVTSVYKNGTIRIQKDIVSE
jgi:hypothetical protein